MNWSIFGLLSSISFGIQGTIAYELLDVQSLGSAAVNTIIHCIFAIFGVIFVYLFKKYDITISISDILSNFKGLIFLAGICALLGNVLLYWAYQLGTDINPGIITTISNGAVIISTILAYFFFHKNVSLKQMLGIFVMIIAFTMGAMGNKLFGLTDTTKEGLESREQYKKDQKRPDRDTGYDDDNNNDKSKNTSNDKQLNNDDKNKNKNNDFHNNKNHDPIFHKVEHDEKGDHKSKDKKSSTDKNKKQTGFPFWVIVAILSAISYAGLSFFQYIVTQKAPKMNMIALAIMVAVIEALTGVVIYILTYVPGIGKLIQQGPFANYQKDINSLFNIKYYLLTFLPALFDGAGLATLLQSYKLAPNPGFSDTISDSYSVIQSILTWVIYGKKMDLVQILSIIVSIIGIALIST